LKEYDVVADARNSLGMPSQG
jgi:hypothetical protein